MDFNWTDEQKELRRAAEEFAQGRLVEGAAERDQEKTFSRELWDACAEFGLQGILVPEAWDGGGHDLLTAVSVFEGIGYGCRDNGLVFSVAAHAASCEGPLMEFGSDAQKAEWLPGLVDGTSIGATGITEPDTGSNALALGMTAGRDDARWVLDGSKTFVTNAPIADLFVIYARTGKGFSGLSCFLVPRDTEGLTIGPPMEKMGLRTSPIAQIYLDGCRLPESALVGAVGSGAMIFSQTMDTERLLVMAPAVGVMERLLERCVAHARQRTTGAGPIGKNQAISHRIADMELRLESARLLLYRAAWQRQHHGKATRESALAKLAVSEAYVDCCRSAMQIFGGYGYMVDYEIERELRDALATTLYVGTSEIQRNLVAGLEKVWDEVRDDNRASTKDENQNASDYFGGFAAGIAPFDRGDAASAHNVGESYLYLQIEKESVSGRFEVALRDFNHALGLDDTPEEITAATFEKRSDFLKSYYLDHVSIFRGNDELNLEFTEHKLINAQGGFATLSFDLPELDGDVPDVLTFDYSVLLDEEHHHRGFLLVEYNWATGTFANENQISLVFEPDDRRKEFELKTDGRWRGFVAVVGLGIEHIWEGIDHILFLVALLLPAVLRRGPEDGDGGRVTREWRPVERFGPAFVHVVKIVTAFTVAHSITLSLAALGLVDLPGALVETVIAASIAIAAADLLVPVFRGRLWIVVVAFGLFHGFGFAGALSEMGVLGERKLLPLLAFNLGVEIGQVCIVAVLVPILFLVRRPALYRKVALPAAAVFLIGVSGVWVAERAFGVDVPMYESLPPAVQKFVP